MKAILTILMAMIVSVGCGVENDNNSNLNGTSFGLQGKYQDGIIDGANYFIYTKKGISAGNGLSDVINAVAGKKTLKPGSYKVNVGKDAMITVGYFHSKDYIKHFEMWFDGDNLLGDRILLNAGKEIGNDFFTLAKGGESRLSGVFGAAHQISIKNLGGGKVKVTVEKL